MISLFDTLPPDRARVISPITLAFVGDAVYSLFVRHKLVLLHDYSPNELQKHTSSEVSAHGQNTLLERILPKLTEEEQGIFKRGRNAKKSTRSKSASVYEYNNSTGIEAVIGYLYLSGQYDRISQLLSE